MNSPVGFLYSQIGYDLGRPLRAIVRGGAGELSPAARFRVLRGAAVWLEGAVTLWGEKWGSHWWIADFSGLSEGGRFTIEIVNGDARFGGEIEVGAGLLWQKSGWLASVDQAERRARLAKNGVGWQDCGAHWQEANSHAAFALGLLDVLEHRAGQWNTEERARLGEQIVNGADYLALLQDQTDGRGDANGALIHELPTFPDTHLPGDALQAAVVWARAARLLGDDYAARKADYTRRAALAFAWFERCEPCGAQGFNPTAHGVADDWQPPREHLSHDLTTALWAAWELSRLDFGSEDVPDFARRAAELARELCERQVSEGEGQFGFYGYFRTYASADLPEKAWLHSLGKSGIGSDVTATFPHYLVPLIEMLRAHPAHPDAGLWQDTVRDFAYGYFLPACQANPFLLLPLGIFAGQGLLWFAGLWHGMNGVYGWAAALGFEFEALFGDARFGDIAVGNLQWIAGLNAGLSSDSLFASHMWSADVPPGVALPVSMICGIGARTAGTWLAVRGSICNGFSTGDQFTFDVAPMIANDGPHSFTDEDWIPHAGGWLCALCRA